MESTNRKLASIQRIDKIEPIVGADLIELASILGYKTVVKKGEFNAGDLAVYVECDSILPEWPDFEFMRSNKFRVKIKRYNKFGDIFSQGILFPMSILKMDGLTLPELGMDVTDKLGIIKYEPKVTTNVGNQKGNFPYFIPITDEERLQSKPELLERIRYSKVRATLKLDGSSITYYNDGANFGACTHRVEIKDEDNVLWNLARKYQLPYILNNQRLAIQAELCGEGYNGSGKFSNPLGIKGQDFFVYNIFDIQNQYYLDEYLVDEFCKRHGLKRVPVVKVWDNFGETVESLIEFSKTLKYSDKIPAEGIVVRPIMYAGGKTSFKVINPYYESLVENDK